MATNVITVSTNIQIVNGNFKFNFNESGSFDQTTAAGGNPGTVKIGTSEEDISFGDITTEGLIVMKNLDPTNSIEWGPKSGGVMVPVGKMGPGKWGSFWYYPTAVLRVKALVAICKMYIAVMEE